MPRNANALGNFRRLVLVTRHNAHRHIHAQLRVSTTNQIVTHGLGFLLISCNCFEMIKQNVPLPSPADNKPSTPTSSRAHSRKSNFLSLSVSYEWVAIKGCWLEGCVVSTFAGASAGGSVSS